MSVSCDIGICLAPLFTPWLSAAFSRATPLFTRVMTACRESLGEDSESSEQRRSMNQEPEKPLRKAKWPG